MTVEVEGLVKHFRVHRRDPWLRASLRGLVRREHVEVRAVEDVSLYIAEGEMVGFLGPNGAGKTTTLKCLTGLPHPRVAGLRVAGAPLAARTDAAGRLLDVTTDAALEVVAR